MNTRLIQNEFGRSAMVEESLKLHEVEIEEEDCGDCLIYIRVSTSKQMSDGNGLDAQLNFILPYCKLKGYKVNPKYIFIDGGRSAKDLLRPDYQRMLSLIKTRKWNKVVIAKRDRLIRNNPDLATVRNEISVKYNCTIESVKDGVIDWKNGNEKFLQNVLTAKDSLELDQVSERTKDCLYASALKGNYTLNHTPLGMRRCIRGAATKAIKIVEECHEDIEYAFNYIVNCNENNRKIMNHFNQMQLLGIEWTPVKLRQFVTTNIYYGTLITPSFTIEDHTPAVVNKQLFLKAQKVVFKTKRREIRNYVFSNYVVCKICGTSLESKSTFKRNRNGSRKSYYYYTCSKCNKRINENILMEHMDEVFEYKVSQKEVRDKINDLEGQIKRRENCILDVNESFIDNIVSYEFWKKSLDLYKNEIKSLQTEYSLIKSGRNYGFRNMSLPSKKKYLSEHLEKIEVDFKKNQVNIILVK